MSPIFVTKRLTSYQLPYIFAIYPSALYLPIIQNYSPTSISPPRLSRVLPFLLPFSRLPVELYGFTPCNIIHSTWRQYLLRQRS